MSLFHTENRNRFWFLKLKKHRKIKRYTKILQQICTASIEKSKENTDCCNCKLLVIILSSKTDGQNNQLVLAVCILRKNNSFWSGVVLRNLSIRRKETIKFMTFLMPAFLDCPISLWKPILPYLTFPFLFNQFLSRSLQVPYFIHLREGFWIGTILLKDSNPERSALKVQLIWSRSGVTSIDCNLPSPCMTRDMLKLTLAVTLSCFGSFYSKMLKKI